METERVQVTSIRDSIKEVAKKAERLEEQRRNARHRSLVLGFSIFLAVGAIAVLLTAGIS